VRKLTSVTLFCTTLLGLSPSAHAFDSVSVNSVDSVSINPELALSLPQPLQIGAMAYCEGSSFLCDDSLSYFITGGYLGLSLNSGSRSLQLYTAELGARFFPVEFPLFFSLGIGYRSITYSVNISAFQIADSSVASNAALSFYSFYAEPAVGWQFSLSDTFALSFQLGLQVPLFPGGNLNLYNTQTGANSNNSDELTVDNANYLSRIGNIPLPTMQLRLTWFL